MIYNVKSKVMDQCKWINLDKAILVSRVDESISFHERRIDYLRAY